jgi:hypothetical protein
MEKSTMHIAVGDSAGGLLVAVGYARESILIQHDPLSVGPLRRLKSLDEWRAVREEFWDRIGAVRRTAAAGETFLEGSKNFTEANGIDEWVAGVHLDSRAAGIWFRHGETLVAGSAA